MWPNYRMPAHFPTKLIIRGWWLSIRRRPLNSRTKFLCIKKERPGGHSFFIDTLNERLLNELSMQGSLSFA